MLMPPRASVPAGFQNVSSSFRRHTALLQSMQRLRGKLYAEEGAIRPSQLSPDGCHRLPADRNAWHLLRIGNDDNVQGCSRYTSHSNRTSYSELGVRDCPLATSREWGTAFRDAVESDLELARNRGVAYVEVGGWALAPELRCSAEAIRIALATYSLARMLGGCIGIATVTRRHCSSSILRRIGGRPLTIRGTELPVYYDAQYGCEMEVLRFDSTEPNPRYEIWIKDLCDYLLTTAVVVRQKPVLRIPGMLSDPRVGLRDEWSLGPDLAHAV